MKNSPSIINIPDSCIRNRRSPLYDIEKLKEIWMFEDFRFGNEQILVSDERSHDQNFQSF